MDMILVITIVLMTFVMDLLLFALYGFMKYFLNK